jgi:D-alanyl-D-alanine carboxypeptidase/D-alanyl-D-alanine-endopeptidase (penicillin-binding protein 4)
MLELFGSGLISLWLDMAGVKVKPVDALDVLALQGKPGLVVAVDPNPVGEDTIRRYLQKLQAEKLPIAQQGIWIQSGPVLLSNHQGTTPLPAASLTKVATTITALKTWRPNHQFETLISTTGQIVDGVLQGDLVINGGGDPMFVWEEGITLGNNLNKLGIRSVTGNLVITGTFGMNYSLDPVKSGAFLREAINSATWQRAATKQHAAMPKGTPKPQVAIAGNIEVGLQANTKPRLLIRHLSLPLRDILREMNIYSNNEISQMLGELAGGAPAVMSIASSTARFPPAEIQLINTSGLGVQNRISPRAACAMFIALQRQLAPHNLTVADLMPVSGRDNRGTMLFRTMPKTTVFKTGTLNDVSALAGVIPTRDRGLVWFAIINRGTDILRLRAQQDELLQELLKQLKVAPTLPAAVSWQKFPNPYSLLGAPSRNQIVAR